MIASSKLWRDRKMGARFNCVLKIFSYLSSKNEIKSLKIATISCYSAVKDMSFYEKLYVLFETAIT